MPSNRETLLCHYHYDPLDRLVDCTLPVTGEASIQRFYQKNRLATEVQCRVQRSIMQYDDQLLAQQQRQTGTVATRLLATDQQRSVLNVLEATQPNPLAYTAYGHRPSESGLLSLLGFNGERPDPVTGFYLLGNGYRAFNPVLMRFNSPDSWSPFGMGGLNTYAYCAGDPVNQDDRTGHFGNPLKGLLNLFGRPSRMARAEQAYKIAKQVPLEGLSERAPLSIPAAIPESLYSSVGSTSSSKLPSSLPSSGYASVRSYTSVDASLVPSLPKHSPPGSSRAASVLSVWNSERMPSGRPPSDIRTWAERTGEFPNGPLPELGEVSNSILPLAVQDAGVRMGRNIRMNSNLYREGIFPVPLEDLRSRFHDKYLSVRRS